MNMKETAILLIFLLSILGVIMGIIYTESDIDSVDASQNQEIINESANGTIIITIASEPDNNGINILT